MTDFKVQNYVSDLIKLLGFEKVNEGFYDFGESLLKRHTQNVVSKMSNANLKKLSEHCPSPEDLVQKYDELKIKHVREVDALVSLLCRVKNDEKVRSLLKADTPNANITDEISITNLNGKMSSRDNKRQVISTISTNRRNSYVKRAVPAGICPFPNWVRERCNLSWDFNFDFDDNAKPSGPIGILPNNVQESRLIDDVLFCLVGIDGDYIHSKKLASIEANRHFSLDDSANISLKLLVQNMMPVFSHYSTIMRFIEAKIHYEEGLVNHALSATMRTFLKDYFVLVSQLESQHLQHNLTLQKLWFYLQPALATMETISNIATILTKGDCFGGNVLTVLHENTTSLIGSNTSREICHTLARAATRPYFEILEKWIYKGIISDYYSEFLVQDNELIKKEDLPAEYSNDYWEKRYTIRRDQMPKFLHKAANMILRTGKYLNVIRQCGKTIDCPDAKSIIYTMRESQYVEYIEPAYKFASKKLLDLLMDEADLKRRLVSVKHYFLLDQGDFIIQFMDMAEEELKKQTDDVMFTRLESLLELALRTSVVNEDKYKDDVKIELLPTDLLTQMFRILQIPPDPHFDFRNTSDSELTGLEAFTFIYEVKWPLSLVLNIKSLAYYQILFRHLFYCKHIENLLGRLWSLNKRTKSFPRSESCVYAPAFALRQQMLHFIQNLDYYLTLEVIEPHWQDFYKKISQVTNVDEVLFYHDDFLEKCVTDCMLTNPRLLQILAKLMKLCVEFSNFLQDIMKSCMDIDVSIVVDSITCERPFTELSNSPAALENFKQNVSGFEKDFNEGIITMLNILHTVNKSKQASKIINMLYRLDFSRFYEKMSFTDHLKDTFE